MTRPEAVTAARVLTYHAGRLTGREDAVAVEEPLELRVQDGDGSVTLAVTMRTPGHDRELVLGWLHAEGLLEAVTRLSVLRDTPNVVLIRGDPERLRAGARSGVTSAACGVCGSGSVERLSVWAAPPVWTAEPLAPEVLLGLPGRLRAAQPGFAATGGLHAAGLFTPAGDRLAAFEDVGRHNAVDKLVGWALERGQLPLTDRVLVTSSRAGFEIVQKAALAGIPVVLTVGAPSSLAVETATALNLTLIGFARADHFNVYAGAERLQP
ncbi:Formate dehydrogenase family accessory protein FdhD [Deinococcus phoenicis]|uniref:Sulfur carrier protein FdhD n=1 Tax=Deinococcus phoenicis TaxID=1476583 RepID=A0A016QNP1_9DEIO|nr:formate dehydrogenase accessory sulfurtransferase FdhD [Deinococcus phoenicis]EYB67487.1 Formate dehydrogenase family accessory protein FdhD [Deinococcus phoenicis]